MRRGAFSLLRIVAVVLGLTVFLAVSGAAQRVALQPVQGGSGSVATLASVRPGGPVTVESRIHLGDRTAINGMQTVWLAGLATSPVRLPSLLSLVWSQDTSAWFPTWNLYLQTDAALFPDTLGPQAGRGALAGSSTISLGAFSPLSDHVIESRLSYDPATGRLDVSVIDVTDNKQIVARSLIIRRYEGTAYPAVGLVASGSPVEFESFQASPWAVPFGTAWEFMMREDGQYRRLVLARLTQSAELALRVGPEPQNFPGRFRLVADDGVQQKAIFDLGATARTQAEVLPFTARDLPVGQFTLRYEYVDPSGRAWQLGASRLQVVAANLVVQFSPLTLEGKTLHGSASVRSEDEVLFGVPFRLRAATKSLSDTVERTRLVVDQQLELISGAPVVVPFSIPIDRPEQLFNLILTPEFGTEVNVRIVGNEYWVWQ